MIILLNGYEAIYNGIVGILSCFSSYEINCLSTQIISYQYIFNSNDISQLVISDAINPNEFLFTTALTGLLQYLWDLLYLYHCPFVDEKLISTFGLNPSV